MSARNLPPNVEIEVEPEDVVIRRLVRALDYAEGFWLGFVKSNTRAQRRRAAAACKDLLEPLKIRAVEIELTEPVSDLLPVIRARLEQEQEPVATEGAQTNAATSSARHPKLAVFVYGLEHSISSQEEHPAILSSLNLSRELFRQQLPHPLLLWLPDYALTALARQAPDFWAWRSGLYEFAPERETAEQVLSTVRGEAVHVTASLSEAAKRERLTMLKGLLDDYRELGSGPHEQYAQRSILHTIGLIHRILGNLTEAKKAYEEALEIARRFNDASGISIMLHQLGILALMVGDYEEAQQFYTESLGIARSLDDQNSIAISLHELGRLAQAQGNIEEAWRLYNESLGIARRLGDQEGVAISLHQLGVLAEDQGNAAEARRLYNESLGIARRLGDQEGVASSLHQLGGLAQIEGDVAEAWRLYNESLEIKKRLGDQHGIATTLNNLALLAEDDHDKAEAARLFREALEIFDKVGSPYADTVRRNLARVEG